MRVLTAAQNAGLERVVISGNPGIRRQARRMKFLAAPRPPAPRHLPAASCLILDARRPEDVALANGTTADVVMANSSGVNNLALLALGATAWHRFRSDQLPVEPAAAEPAVRAAAEIAA